MNTQHFLFAALTFLITDHAAGAEQILKVLPSSCDVQMKQVNAECEVQARAEARSSVLPKLSAQCKPWANLAINASDKSKAANTKANTDEIIAAMERCKDEFERVGLWRVNLDIYERAMKCSTQRMPSECRNPLTDTFKVGIACKEKTAELCGGEVSGFAVQQCYQRHRQELVLKCKRPSLEGMGVRENRGNHTQDAKLVEHWKKFKPVDNSTPVGAAILKQHSIVMRGDKAAYTVQTQKIAANLPSAAQNIFTPSITGELFKQLITTSPPKLWIAPAESFGYQKVQSFYLAGCTFVPAYGNDIRVFTQITPSDIDGQMEVFLQPFSPAVGDIKYQCPM